MPLLPLHSTLPPLPPLAAPRSHPPPLCPLTTWHLFRFIPISWQTACISPAGHNAAILANQWQINQCYLFFPCLCCHRFFFLLLCCLWRFELCSIKLSSLSGTNCNSIRLSGSETDINVSSGWGLQALYLWDAPFKQRLLWFLLKLNLDLLWTPLSDEACQKLALIARPFILNQS